ncbi:hypothetical protein DXB38_00965 [Blautia obeum]|jgi:hypothetical protein|uniref:Uncharacterized protein n=1 Tax=Blautia obeum TaxID=40520 RepID=A0A3E5ENP6_9FIRM|nr:hypothetical protein DXB38_00965 [Blautia obeum]DAP97435.1 MAG TPA: hypothetical protein [Caudoviricetes sp.]
MRIVVKRIPIEIIELGIETYAQIDIEEILLISYPPITKTVLKFYTEYIAFEFQNEYSVKIKNDDAVIKCYRGNTLNTFIQKDAGERTVAEWRKVISRSENTPYIVRTIDSIKVPDEDVIKTVASDAEELQKTKPVELDELSEETKFRIYKLIVNEIGKHFYNCEMRMSYKDFILVEDCIRKVLQREQDEHKTD